MISVSEIRREKTTIFFSFYTNSNMRSLCRLMTPNGVSVRTVLFNSEHRQHGQFTNVSPKKEYRLQCDIGDDVSKNGGVFVASSAPIVIPRDHQNVVVSVIELVLVVVIVVVGLVGLLILFNYPEFFDVFFAKAEEPEKQSLLKKRSRKGKKSLLSEWVCDYCHASNPNSSAICSECHRPRGGEGVNNNFSAYAMDDDSVMIDMKDEDRSNMKMRHHSHHASKSRGKSGRKEVKRIVVGNGFSSDAQTEPRVVVPAPVREETVQKPARQVSRPAVVPDTLSSSGSASSVDAFVRS